MRERGEGGGRGAGRKCKSRGKGRFRCFVSEEENLCGQFINIAFRIIQFSVSCIDKVQSCFELKWIIDYTLKQRGILSYHNTKLSLCQKTSFFVIKDICSA